MFDGPVMMALLVGLATAAALPVGAGIAMIWHPSDRIMAVMLAFGGGALVSAVTVELVAPGVDHGHFGLMAFGIIVGAILFKVLDALINRKGGYLRKPSTAMTFWRDQARRQVHKTLRDLRRTDDLSDLSPEAENALLSIMLVRDVPAGTCLHNAGDPAQNLYIVERGEIELVDPRAQDKVVERLTRHDFFGLRGVAAGVSRTTEAYAVRDTRLLMLPRAPFMALLPEVDELRALIAKQISDHALESYLVSRHGMTREEVVNWRSRALASLEATGRFDPPHDGVQEVGELIAFLKSEPRENFFATLSDGTLEDIARRMVCKTHEPGYTFYHRGEMGDRLYLMRRGSVQLVNPEERTREPKFVDAGDTFGGLAFLTEGTHSVTAVGRDETKVYELRRSDFDYLLERLPDLRDSLSSYLKGKPVAGYVSNRHGLKPEMAAQWVEDAAKSVARGKAFPALSDVTRRMKAHDGAAMAIFLGIMLDGIPEAFVLGSQIVTAGLSLSLVAALILANLPEALSSAAGMKAQGIKPARIMLMWSGLMVLAGLCSAVGAAFLRGAPEPVFAVIEGIAAGAILTMVAETMLPEAFHKGAGVVGLSFIAGFLATTFFGALG